MSQHYRVEKKRLWSQNRTTRYISHLVRRRLINSVRIDFKNKNRQLGATICLFLYSNSIGVYIPEAFALSAS